MKTTLIIFEDFDSINEDNNELRNSKRTKSSSWILPRIGVVVFFYFSL